MKRPTARPPDPPLREPTSEELAASVDTIRERIRRWADLFDHLATIAANAGSLQAAFRELAARLRAHGDRFCVAILDSEDGDARCDVATICLLDMTLQAGHDNYAGVARTIESIIHRDGRS